MLRDPLDSLLDQALSEASRRRTKAAEVPPPKHPKLDAGFYAPENWTHTRTISLFHEPSHTLLGNFKELVYDRRGSRARKLIRVSEPCATDGTEEVRGDWWLTQEAERHLDETRWIETREAIVGITLAECGLHCPDAHVRVRLEFGGIARVELAAETRFTCASRNTFLILPAGLDVMEATSLDTKLAIRAEMGL